MRIEIQSDNTQSVLLFLSLLRRHSNGPPSFHGGATSSPTRQETFTIFSRTSSLITCSLNTFYSPRATNGVKMIGSFITRGLVLVFGYAYPAYECYKTVEMNKPDIEQLVFWCQYWILVAGLTVCERIGDMFISWVPMYSEAKLAFFLYLWFPKTKGTTYVYDSFFRPYVAKHETEIDRNLLELRTRAGDMLILYWQKASSYGQTRIFDVLQYIASQSTPPRRAQPQKEDARVRQPAAPQNAEMQAQDEPPSPTSSASLSQHQEDEAEVSRPSEGSVPATPPAGMNAQKTTPAQALVETAKTLNSTEEQVMHPVPPPTAIETTEPPPQEAVMQEPGRITRARSRRARDGSVR